MADPDADGQDGADTAGRDGQVGQDGEAGAIKGMLAGIQQRCQHITRRCKQVLKLGPGGLQSWASKIIPVLGEAHATVQAAKTDGHTSLDPQTLAGLRARYESV